MVNYTIQPIRNPLLSLIKKCFLSTTSTTISSSSPPYSFTVHFLIDSCGLPLQSALSVSKKFQIDEKRIQNPLSVLQFFKAHNFDSSHIASVIEKWPELLRCRVRTVFNPKFDFLIQNGFVGDLLPQLVVSNPAILKRGLDSHIKPSFFLWKSLFGGSNDRVVAAVMRRPWLLSFSLKEDMQQNVDLLRKEGVPVAGIVKLVTIEPTTILHNYDKMIHRVTTLKKWGLDPKAPGFLRALSVFVYLSESTWKKKSEVLKSFGWTEAEILSVFKRQPYVMASSEKKITTAMDFLENTAKLGRHCIISNPVILLLSMEKRIRPRYNVLKVLELKKLIKGNNNIVSLLKISEKKFIENYVAQYEDEVPGLRELYMGNAKVKKMDS